MSYIFKTNLVSSDKYGVKCPYPISPEGICVHNTANDAPAENEIKYMISNNMEISFHVAVDDKEVVQGLPFDRNGWHAGDGGNGDGNRKYLAVEICYSKSGGNRFIQAEKNAAKWIAETLKNHNWTIANVKKHQDFSGKYCPHRTLDMGWQRFLDMVQAELDQLNAANVQTPQPVQRTYEHKIGEHVVFSTCYRSSTDPISAHLSAAQMSRNHGVITRIVDAPNPYLLDDGLCWVNDGDIRGLYIDHTEALKPAPQPQVNYYPCYIGNSASIVEGLQAVGADSSFTNRENIAVKNGITSYRGSADQNNRLLSLLKSGKLIK